MSSLLEKATPDTFYDIFVLHGPECDFSSSRLNELPLYYKNCRITFRRVVGEFVDGYETRGITKTAYYRLIAPEMIPEYDKILYSDVDVVFREDLSRYFFVDLGDCYFGGVDNCSRLRPEVRRYVSGLGLAWEKGFFYSGNLVINSRLLIADGKLDEFRQLGKNAYAQQDMDIINIACNERFFSLAPSFCMTVPLFNIINDKRHEMDELYGHDVISYAIKYGAVHYNGAKPWKECCLNMDIWWNIYRKSIFYDERFAHSFWWEQCNLLSHLPFKKRVKLLLRYPLDKKALSRR